MPTAVHGIRLPTSFRAKKSWSHGTARTTRKARPIAATRQTRHQVYGRAMIARTHIETRKSVSVAALVSASSAPVPE